MKSYPIDGRYGRFGGRFVPETLMPALEQLEAEYLKLKADDQFKGELDYYLSNYAGRPTPLYYAKNLTEKIGGAKIYLKREDLLHGGSHKMNNTLGQALLARRMSKSRVIAETGAGQHGVATAMACSMLGLKCEIYMGLHDAERQKLNVYRMRLLGADVHRVEAGSKTLKDAINEALRDWVTNVETTHYLIGSVVGPHPYPMIVRDFQSVVGREVREQMLLHEQHLPDAIVACVGGGSNSMGIFYPFLNDTSVELYGVEAGGLGLEGGKHAAPLLAGSEGVLHGMFTYLLQDEHGQIQLTHSIAAGLDYSAVGPEHSFLKESSRANYTIATDEEALQAFHQLSILEGIIPALESSHALAFAMKLAKEMEKHQIMVVNLSGRGDKDVNVVAQRSGVEM